MICSDCGREINDGSLTCQYCGKVFISQRARPDESLPAHEQVVELATKLQKQEQATDHAVTFRRQQRWIFYGVIALLVIGSIIMAVNIYAGYTELANNYAQVGLKLKAREDELTRINKDLAATQVLLNENSTDVIKLRDDLDKNRKNLLDMTERNKKLEEESMSYKQDADTCSAKRLAGEAVNYNFITRLGIKLPATEIAKMPVSVVTADMLDTDKDGLVDEFEIAIGTDPMKADTDGDGYDDKTELESGYNPNGADKYSDRVSESLRGRIIYSEQNAVVSAWYVGQNYKRNFLGISTNNFEFMHKNAYWIQR